MGVSSWKDVKAGYDAIQTTDADRPQWSATSFNGYPGVTFDGVSESLICTDAALLALLPGGSNPSELWAVVQQDDVIADTTVRAAVGYGNGSFVSRRLARVVTSSVNRARAIAGDGAAANINASNTSIDFSSRHLMRGNYTATSVGLTLDGTTEVVAAGVPNTTVSRLRIGSLDQSGFSQGWKGKIRDVIVTLPLNASQVAALQAWGLPRRAL